MSVSMSRGHQLPHSAILGQVRRSGLFWNWRVIVDLEAGDLIYVMRTGSKLFRGDAQVMARNNRNGVRALGGLDLGTAERVRSNDSARWATVS